MTTHEDQKRAEGFLADAAVWGDEYATVGLGLCNELAAAQDQLRHVRMTLEAVEHAVAIVYGHFSNGRLTKCNTDPQQVIAVIEDVINAEYEKENLTQWILEAEQGRAEMARLRDALREIWEAGDLNDKQMDAYRRVIPFEGRDILPLYESSKDVTL